MHQRHNISIRTIKRPIIALCGILSLLVLLQVAARSEIFLRGPLEARLPAIAYTLNGRIEVDHIRPAGLWGVELQGVRFFPLRSVPARAPDRPLAHLDSIIVHPDIGAILRGSPRATTVQIDTPRISVVVDGGAGPHADWFRWATYEIRQSEGQANAGGTNPPRPAATDEAAQVQLLIQALPRVELDDGQFSFDDVSGAVPSLGLRVQDVTYRPPDANNPGGRVDGDVLIEGLGRGRISGALEDGEQRLSLRFVDSNDIVPLLPFDVPSSPDAHLSVGGVHVDWPPSITVSDLRATDLDAAVPGVDFPIASLTARDVVLHFSRAGLRAVAREVAVRDTTGAAPAAIPSTTLSRGWTDRNLSAEIVFADAEGDLATLIADLPEDGPPTAHIRADGFNIAPLIAFARRESPPLTAGTFTGDVRSHWDPENRALQSEIDGDLAGLEVHVPALCDAPLQHLDLSVEATIGVWPDTNSVLLQRGRLYFAPLDFVASIDASRAPERTTLQLNAVLPRRDAQQVLDALPEGFADTLEGFRLSGQIGARFSLAIDTDHLDDLITDFSYETEDFEVIEYGPRAPIDRFAEPDFVWTVHTRDGPRTLGPGDADWVALTDVPPLTFRALVAAEDDRFWIHEGFDARGLRSALRANIEAGHVVRGGSTISQQVTKNLFLSHDRTVARKVQETFLTWLMERELGKDAILELYMNLAHWGEQIYGIRQGAMAYFGHAPGQLTLRESAFLAAILPNPRVFGGQYLDGQIVPSRRTKMGNILNNLRRAGYLSLATYTYHRNLVERGTVSHGRPAEIQPSLEPIAAMPSSEVVLDDGQRATPPIGP